MNRTKLRTFCPRIALKPAFLLVGVRGFESLACAFQCIVKYAKSNKNSQLQKLATPENPGKSRLRTKITDPCALTGQLEEDRGRHVRS